MGGKGQGKGAQGTGGLAMPLVLVATAILAASLTGLLGVLAVPIRSARTAQAGDLAFYAAEAGVHHAVSLTLGYSVWKWDSVRRRWVWDNNRGAGYPGLGWCQDPLRDRVRGSVFPIVDSENAFSTVALYEFRTVEYDSIQNRCRVEVYGYPNDSSLAGHCLAAWIQYDATQNKVWVQYDLCQEG